MPEIDYDDSILSTSENLAGVDWDGLETGGLASEGQHLAYIKKIGGYIHNFKDYTGPRAKVMFQIKEGKDKGKVVYDDIGLPNVKEADGSRNRRLLIASRMGLIPKGTKETKQVNWKILEGRDVLITVEHNTATNGKTYANITFDGWQDPAMQPSSAATIGQAAATPPDQYADI